MGENFPLSKPPFEVEEIRKKVIEILAITRPEDATGFIVLAMSDSGGIRLASSHGPDYTPMIIQQALVAVLDPIYSVFHGDDGSRYVQKRPPEAN